MDAFDPGVGRGGRASNRIFGYDFDSKRAKRMLELRSQTS
jgi:hypothetical protein